MPTSLIPNWLDEAERFAPDLRAGSTAPAGAATSPAIRRARPGADHLCPAATRRRRAGQAAVPLILDEAQNIKNATTKAAVAARELAARHRLCLTGTPLENHLGELWSLFHFLMPGWLGDARQFAQDYRTPIEKHGDEARLSHLAARLRPFLLRRTKEQVASNCRRRASSPSSSNSARRNANSTRPCVGWTARSGEEIARRGLARSRIVILEALLKLRQVCCDTRLLQRQEDGARSGRAPSSGKLAYLLDMLDELIAEGRRVLLFRSSPDARADRGRPAPARSTTSC